MAGVQVYTPHLVNKEPRTCCDLAVITRGGQLVALFFGYKGLS